MHIKQLNPIRSFDYEYNDNRKEEKQENIIYIVRETQKNRSRSLNLI